VAELSAVNTSPLIYLSRAKHLHLLQLSAARIVVPEAVVTEIRAWPTADAAVRAVETETWLEIIPPLPVPQQVIAWDLGAGESAVLAWGDAHRGNELIIDDLAARRCAAALGFPVRGTLGLVLIAKRRGIISAARPVLNELLDAEMFLSSAVIDAALREIGE
jgi:predicted nucleic acid-binding protein